jgi:hypothetical protein
MQSNSNLKNGKVVNTHTHTPKPVCEHEDVTVLWNQVIHADGEVMANRPDATIKKIKGEMCILRDVAIQADRNIRPVEVEKINKYKSLCTRWLKYDRDKL